MNALYTLEELGFIKDKVEIFRYRAEKGEIISEEIFRDFFGDINLYLRRRFKQSSSAIVSKEDMEKIHDLVKTILDNFGNIDDYYKVFDDIFLLIVSIERLVTFPKNGGPAAVGV